ATPLRRAANNPRWTQHKGAVKPYIITAFLCPKTTFYETPAHLRAPRTAARQALAPGARRQADGPGERRHDGLSGCGPETPDGIHAHGCHAAGDRRRPRRPPACEALCCRPPACRPVCCPACGRTSGQPGAAPPRPGHACRPPWPCPALPACLRIDPLRRLPACRRVCPDAPRVT